MKLMNLLVSLSIMEYTIVLSMCIILVEIIIIFCYLAPKCSLGILLRTSRFCISPPGPRRSVSSDHHDECDNDADDHHDESVSRLLCRANLCHLIMMMIVKTIVKDFSFAPIIVESRYQTTFGEGRPP